MKFKALVGILLTVLLTFGFCGTAFADSNLPAMIATNIQSRMHQFSDKQVIPAPTASIPSGTYNSAKDVRLSDTNRKQFTIYYTLDGTMPNAKSKAYNGPVTLATSCNLKAIAVDSSGNTSGVLDNTYVIAPAKPSASIPQGKYNTVQNVKLTDETQGASIYYTLDGSTPSTKSILYTAPVAVSKSLTLKASAIDSTGTMSKTLSVSYTINNQTTAAPSPTASANGPASSPLASPAPSPLASAAPSPTASAAPSPTASASAAPAPSPSTAPISPAALSVWVAYWDWQSGMSDVNAMAQMPGSVEMFGASFNDKDKLFLPDEMQTLSAATVQSAHPGVPVYLTIVNDREDANGNWSEKDSGLLDRLMQSDDSRTSHINDILNIASQGNYSGVEIDYEKISDGTWSGFAAFCTQLYAALKAKGLGMRVCLEESAPFAKGGLPAGPEYTVMAYDLYWQGSAPGPKADYSFIKQVAQKMAALPGNKRMAFAAGGYDWASKGNCTEVTESQAAKLSQKSTNLQRDNQSGGLHFTYQANGVTHTVWYADATTLKGWFDQSKSLGIGNIALWKMGGSMPETIQMLSGMR